MATQDGQHIQGVSNGLTRNPEVATDKGTSTDDNIKTCSKISDLPHAQHQSNDQPKDDTGDFQVYQDWIEKFYQDGIEEVYLDGIKTDLYQADFHQAGTEAGDESENIGNDSGNFQFYQDGTEKLYQDGIETDLYQANFHQAGTEAGDESEDIGNDSGNFQFY